MNCDKVKGNIEIILYGCNNNGVVNLGKSINEIKNKNPNGSVGEILVTNDKIFLGIGNIEHKDVNGSYMAIVNIQRAMKKVAERIKENYIHYEITIANNPFIREAIHGLIQSLYKFDSEYFTDQKTVSLFPKIRLKVDDKETYDIAIAQCIARFLGDLPPNYLTPKIFVSFVKEMFKNSKNVKIEVFDQKACKKMGMGLFYSVTQGAKNQGMLVTIKYSNNKINKDSHDIALVGKGVIFDSGGISLKKPHDMKQMKCDMMRGATVLSTMLLVVQNKLKLNITCTIPLVENMPGSKSTKPGDVFVSMNGKSVEIVNTDAEGRLILADALTFAQRYFDEKPKYVIDAATLTHAVSEALGNVYGGYFTNSEKLNDIIKRKSKNVEFLQRLPLSVYYYELLDSKVADLVNNPENVSAGASIAAAFLYEFVDSSIHYAHFDIAGISMKGFPHEIFRGTATGRPIKAFYKIIREIYDKEINNEATF